MSDIDNKVVSISFNNRQFLRDVQDTISVIEELNEVTSGNHISTSGIDNLSRAFRSTTSGITRDAHDVTTALSNIQSAANINFQTSGIDALRKALENTGMTAVDVEDTITSLQQLSRTGLAYASDLGIGNVAQQIQNESENTRSVLTQDIDDVSNSFSALEMIGIGAMIAIGEKAAELGANALRSLTAGIRNGWGEYNALTNSTQTILVNTQRWGSTMEDVSGALEELNRYADMTTYSFSDMTRNIGYFTTAGVQLEDSVTAIRGLSNVGAMFGADAQAVARAGYQISQAMSAGVIKLMDWRSMINAGMGGQALQDELIRTAAVMSGTSVDAMNEYIESLGGFNASLQEGWLTSDIFLEAMRTFAGQSREYYEGLTDANGERLYSDEEIDRLVQLGESAMESATQVRTLRQMLDAFSESIGSGWQRTFTLIIGNLEEAKEFWTPINNILTSLVDGFFTLQTGALESWRALGGREELIQGILNVLEALNGVLTSIGGAFMDVFGGSHIIGNRLFRITEAITDFTETLILSGEELQYLRDFFAGILEPIKLVVDVIFELVQAFFNAGDAMNDFSEGTDSVVGSTRPFRTALLAVLGYIGNILKAGAQFIRENNTIRKVIQVFAKVVKTTFSTIAKVISAPFILFYEIWNRYNIGEKLEEFWMKVVTFFLPIIDAVTEVKNVFVDWFDTIKSNLSGLDFDGIDVLYEIFGAIKQLFVDIFDPTVSLTDAFSNFIDTLSGGNTGALLEAIKNSLSGLWEQLKNTALGQWFIDLKDKIQNAWTAFQQTPIGQWLSDIANRVRGFIGLDTTDWDSFWSTLQFIGTEVASDLSTGWEAIKSFFTELWDIVKQWFGISSDAEDASDQMTDAVENTVAAVGNGYGMFGSASILPGVEGIALTLTKTAEAAEYAEEHIPDPSNSKFLTFIRNIPQALSDLFSFTSDDSLLTRIGKVLGSIGEAIRSFFNINIGENEDSNLLTWIVDHLRGLGEMLMSILNINIDFNKGDNIFTVIGSIIGSFINGFSNIDKAALQNLQEIADIIVEVLKGLIALKIFKIIEDFSAAAKAGAKGWADQQAAKKLSAVADVIKSVAIMLALIMVSVVLIMGAINNGKAAQLYIALGTIVATILLLSLAMRAITTSAKDIKPGSITGVSRIISQTKNVLLSIVIAVAALVGIAFVISKLLTNADGTTNKAFVGALIGTVIFFVAIVVGTFFFIKQMYHWANVLYKADAQAALNAVSEAIKSISGLFTSMVVLMIGLIGAIGLMTGLLYIVDKKNAWGAFFGAVAAVVVILALSAGAVFLLIKTAKSMSSGISGVRPAEFKQMIMLMSGLLATVVVSVAVLIAAVTGLVYLMTSMNATAWQIALATGVVALMIVAVCAGLQSIFNSLKGIAAIRQGAVWSSLIVMVLLMVALGGMIGALVYEGVYLSNIIVDLPTTVATLASMGLLMFAIVAAVALIVKVLDSMEFMSFSTRNLILLGSVMVAILITVVGISHTLGYIAKTLSESGFLANGGSIWSIGLVITLMLSVMTFIAYKLVSSAKMIFTIKTSALVKIGAMMILLVVTLLGIAAALTMVAQIDSSKLQQAAVTIGVVMAVGLGLVALLSLFGSSGLGALGLAAASFAILSLSASMLILANALDISARAIDTYAQAMSKLEKINGTKIRNNLHETVKAIPDMILAIAGGIVAANEVIIGAGKTLGTAVATAVFTSIDIFGTLIQGNIASIISNISSVFTGIIRGILIAIRDLIATLIKPGSELWDIIDMLGQFLVQAAEYLGYYGFLIIAKFFEGMSSAIEASGLDLLLVEAINNIWTKIQIKLNDIADTFWDWWTATLNAISDSALEIEGAMVDNDISTVEQQLNNARLVTGGQITERNGTLGYLDLNGNFVRADVAERNVAELEQRLAELQGERQNITDAQSYLAEQTVARFEGVDENIAADNERLLAIQNQVNNALEAERRARGLINTADETASNYTGYNTYIPDAYRGQGLDFRREAEQASSGISTLGDSISNFLGLSDGTSLGERIRGFFGLSEGESAISSIMSALGLSDISTAFSAAGATSGTSYANGFSTSLDTGTYDLGSSLTLPDSIANPVVTPTVDTSEYALGLDNMESIWNSHNFDEFAIDAGTSMTLREQAEGDAATNGAVTYNFTQYNSSPEALSPIQIYRDTNNLLRGRVNS